MKKVLLIGSTVCDIIVTVDHLPKTQESVHPLSQTIRLGGCAYNAAHVVAHLNVPYTFLSPVGTGVYGDFVKKEMPKQEVVSDVSVEQENGSCLCFVEKSGERTFLSLHGAEYSFDPSWMKALDLEEVSYGYLCGLEVEEKDGDCLVDTVCHCNFPFLFAPGPRIMAIPEDRMQRLLNHGVMLHLNEMEALQYTKESSIEAAAANLFSQTNQLVVITAAEKGAYFYYQTGSWVLTDTVKVVDTIGAGDSHAGALLSALSCGASFDKAVSFANKVASKVVTCASSVLQKDTYKVLIETNKDIFCHHKMD